MVMHIHNVWPPQTPKRYRQVKTGVPCKSHGGVPWFFLYLCLYCMSLLIHTYISHCSITGMLVQPGHCWCELLDDGKDEFFQVSLFYNKKVHKREIELIWLYQLCCQWKVICLYRSWISWHVATHYSVHSFTCQEFLMSIRGIFLSANQECPSARRCLHSIVSADNVKRWAFLSFRKCFCFPQIPFIKDCGEDELCICDLVLNVQRKADDR